MKMIVFLSCLVLLAACGRDLGGRQYTSGDTIGKVLRGTVINAEAVVINDSDDPNANAIGGISGGAIGGVAGSSVGGGSGRDLATVGGVIAGAVIGSLIEEQLSTQSGFQYVIQLDPASARKRANELQIEERRRAGSSIEDDIKDSIHTTETDSDLISVVQTDMQPIAPGTPVLLIYHEDRPRVVVDQSRR